MADLVGGMPVIELFNNATVQFEAVDPTDGSPVSGVVITGTSITAVDLAKDTATDTEPPSPVLVFDQGDT